MLVEQEEILNGDPRGLAGFDRDLDPLLGFDGLVDAVPPFAPFGDAAGELVDDHDLAVADDILAIEDEFPLDLDGPLDVFVDVEHAHVVHGRRAWRSCADHLPALGGQFDALLSWSYS